MTTAALPAGSLRHRVTLQALATGQDAAGQPLTTWVDVATVWADMRYVSGLEAARADARTSTLKVSVRIRWRAGVQAAQRVRSDATGQVYEIQAVMPDDTGRTWLDLACIDVNPGATA